MTNDEAKSLINALHKFKGLKLSDKERKFLEDLSFYIQFIGNIKISEKQSKTLQGIYNKSVEA